MKNTQTRDKSSAFTLIELLTVITILSILMGMAMAIISFAQGKAAEDKTAGRCQRSRPALKDIRLETENTLNQWKIMVQVHRVL